MLHRKPLQVRCDGGNRAVQHHAKPVASLSLDRRALMASLAATAGLTLQQLPVQAADSQTVGAYLPAAGVDDLVQFVPSDTYTPALRAGVIRPEDKYAFALPPSVKELRISNTQTGNFCMPRCAEPWTEVVFEDPKLGKVKLLAVPLLKLTNAKAAKITDLGTPDSFLNRIGTYLTETYFDEESVLSAKAAKRDDGLDYYEYELLALDAPYGPHSLTAVTAKGEVVYLFIAQANDKQWSKSEKTLRKVVQSFRA